MLSFEERRAIFKNTKGVRDNNERMRLICKDENTYILNFVNFWIDVADTKMKLF